MCIVYGNDILMETEIIKYESSYGQILWKKIEEW
jgi:hypothetical protein